MYNVYIRNSIILSEVLTMSLILFFMSNFDSNFLLPVVLVTIKAMHNYHRCW